MRVKCTTKAGQTHLRGAIRRAKANSCRTVVLYNGDSYSGHIAFHDSYDRYRRMEDFTMEKHRVDGKDVIQVYAGEHVCIACDSFEEEY